MVLETILGAVVLGVTLSAAGVLEVTLGMVEVL